MKEFAQLWAKGVIQNEVLKALDSSDVANLVRQDIELEAHNQLYTETSPVEMTLFKDIARVPATALNHEYDTIDSYGSDRDDGFISEFGTGNYSASVYGHQTVPVKIMGEPVSTGLIATLQRTIGARGTTNPTISERANKRTLLMRKIARAVYFSDSSTSSSGLRFDGLLATMKKFHSNGTDDWFIDMRGSKLTPVAIRDAATFIGEMGYGQLRGLYMSLTDKKNLETQLDAAERLLVQASIPQANNTGVLLGQVVDGMVTNAGAVYFRPDNTLNPANAGFTAPKATDKFNDSAPVQLPAGNIAVVVTTTYAGADGTSYWAAGDASTDWTYRITAVSSNGEGMFTETAPVTTVAGQEVNVTLTTRSTDTSYKIYRGSPTKTNDWYLVAEVPNNGATVVFHDLNYIIAGGRYAFGLNINSTNFRNPVPALNNEALANNALAIAELAPMSVFDLAKLNLLAANELIFYPFTLEVTRPKQNIVFFNIGDN